MHTQTRWLAFLIRKRRKLMLFYNGFLPLGLCILLLRLREFTILLWRRVMMLRGKFWKDRRDLLMKFYYSMGPQDKIFKSMPPHLDFENGDANCLQVLCYLD